MAVSILLYVVCEGESIVDGPLPDDTSKLAIRRARLTVDHVHERVEVRPGVYVVRKVERKSYELV